MIFHVLICIRKMVLNFKNILFQFIISQYTFLVVALNLRLKVLNVDEVVFSTLLDLFEVVANHGRMVEQLCLHANDFLLCIFHFVSQSIADALNVGVELQPLTLGSHHLLLYTVEEDVFAWF